MKKLCLVFFLILSLIGSFLILLSLSIYLRHTVDVKLEDASLDLNWNRLSIFAITIFLFLFLLLDTIFVLWFIFNMKPKFLIATSLSTYKRYSSDIEYQWNEDVVHYLEERKPNEFKIRIESEKLSSKNTLQECEEIMTLLAQEFNLKNPNTSSQNAKIYIKSFDDECEEYEAIVYNGDQEVLIV